MPATVVSPAGQRPDSTLFSLAEEVHGFVEIRVLTVALDPIWTSDEGGLLAGDAGEADVGVGSVSLPAQDLDEVLVGGRCQFEMTDGTLESVASPRHDGK